MNSRQHSEIIPTPLQTEAVFPAPLSQVPDSEAVIFVPDQRTSRPAETVEANVSTRERESALGAAVLRPAEASRSASQPRKERAKTPEQELKERIREALPYTSKSKRGYNMNGPEAKRLRRQQRRG